MRAERNTTRAPRAQQRDCPAHTEGTSTAKRSRQVRDPRASLPEERFDAPSAIVPAVRSEAERRALAGHPGALRPKRCPALAPFFALGHAATSPRVTAHTRASVLELACALLERGVRLDAGARAQVRDLIALVEHGDSTEADRTIARTTAARLARPPRKREPRQDPIAPEFVTRAFDRCVRAHDHLGALAPFALDALVDASGLEAPAVARAFQSALPKLHADGVLGRYDRRAAAVEDALARLLGVDDVASTGEPGSIVAHVRTRARFASAMATPIFHALPPRELEALRDLFLRAPIHVRFQGEGVADRLARDPIWRAFLESGRTNGNTEPRVREAIERRLFGMDDATPVHARPKYGYLDVTHAPEGQASSFGDCEWILRDEVKTRATISCGDSGHVRAGTLATFDRDGLDHLIDGATKIIGLDALRAMASEPQRSIPWRPEHGGKPWIEVQIHGELDLRRDAAALVLGRAIAATPEGRRLARIAKAYGIPTRMR